MTSLSTENVNPTGPWGPLCTPCSSLTGLPCCSLELALDVVGSLAPSLCSGCSFCLEYLLCLPTTAQEGVPCPGAGQGHLCRWLLSSSTGPSTQLVLVKCLQEGKNNDFLFLALLESIAANLGKSLCLVGPLSLTSIKVS